MKSLPHALSGQISDSDIRQLRIFKAVVECGGFSAAEVQLNISRSAISISMADLEQRLGLRLCQRGRAGFSLTAEGAQVHAATLQLLTSLEGFRTRVNAIHARLKGELNIGITDNLVTMQHMRITDSLARLKQRGPDVGINISMLPPNEIELRVLDGRLHIGVVPDLRTLAGLEYLPLYGETSQLYCSHTHPLFDANSVSSAQILQQDAVVPAYAQTAAIKAQYQPLKASATATDREGIAFLIMTGCYIGFLPTHFADRWVSQGKMRPLLREQMHYVTHYSAITRRGAPDNLILQTYLSELKQEESAGH
ncbi:LysR family transcriptional regulator [Sedimenticola sp.]|uniref:LysR family transcriptional regulator n=1 Tax=Sedimenticola sp. TaxID=1940285 RepID=UPI003D112809